MEWERIKIGKKKQNSNTLSIEIECERECECYAYGVCERYRPLTSIHANEARWSNGSRRTSITQLQVIYLYFSDSIKQFDLLLLLFLLSVLLPLTVISFFFVFLLFFLEFYFYYATFQPQTFYYDHFHLFLVHWNVCICVTMVILTVSSTWYAFLLSFRWWRWRRRRRV